MTSLAWSPRMKLDSGGKGVLSSPWCPTGFQWHGGTLTKALPPGSLQNFSCHPPGQVRPCPGNHLAPLPGTDPATAAHRAHGLSPCGRVPTSTVALANLSWARLQEPRPRPCPLPTHRRRQSPQCQSHYLLWILKEGVSATLVMTRAALVPGRECLH